MAMPAPPATRRYTVEEVLAFPADGNRYEVVHGELLVTPAPATRHQTVVGRLHARLRAYLERWGLGDTVFIGPADYFYESDVYVQPDLLVCPPEEISADWRTVRHLKLVVEVLSPSSTRGDRLIKRMAYQEAGAETYWVVDPDRAVVEVWRPGDEISEIAARELVWRLTAESPELRLDLKDLFARLPGMSDQGGA
jgi:Uma2 family endonuclease